MSVQIYLATSCIRNPGPGAYCALIVFPDGTQRAFLNAFSYTNENQLALLAAVRALWDFREPVEIEIRSRSAYLLRGVAQGKGGNHKRGPRTAFNDEVLWEHLAEKSSGRQLVWALLKEPANQDYQQALRLAQEAATAQAATLELSLGAAARQRGGAEFASRLEK